MKIAILGGTGNEGFGLGFRWALAGHEIIIGSRLAEKVPAYQLGFLPDRSFWKCIEEENLL